MTTQQHTSPPVRPRDLDLLAVWGFAGSFLFWPVGLVLSLVALRRIRRTGDRGHGFAVAGAAISAVLGLVWTFAIGALLTQSPWWDQWAQGRQDRRDAVAIRDVATGVHEDLVAVREDTGAWPQSLRSVAEEIDLDEDGAVRGVVVTAYRSGDDLCVEGIRRRETSASAGSVATDGYQPVPCSDRGLAVPLQTAARDDARAAEAAAREEALALAVERGEQVAAGSTIGPPPEIGLFPPTVDLGACALLEGNISHLGDPVTRRVVAERFAQIVEDMPVDPEDGLGNAADMLAEYPDPAEDTADIYWRGVVHSRWDCWRGGYVGPDGPPAFPTAWTTPRTEESRAAEEADRLAHIAGDEAASARLRARSDAEEAELEAIIATLR